MQSSPTVTASLRTKSHSPKQASGQEIRSRLLRRLGIHEEDGDTLSTTMPVTTFPATQQQQTPRRPSVQPFHVPLKYHKDDSHAKETKSSVVFQEDVSVLPIPMRNEYSQRIKSRLWCDKAELHSMAQRNLVEFEFEGWNWRNVVQDECMIVGMTGELIHPVHCRTFFASNRDAAWRAARTNGNAAGNMDPNQHYFTPPQS